MAASAATFLALSGKKRLIRKNSFLLIHQLNSALIGKYSEISDDHKNATKLMKKMEDFYLNHTKMTEKKLSELLKSDLYLDAKEALRLGFVDEII